MATGVTFSEFNGEVDNWTIYSERLVEYFKANDVSDQKQTAKLLSILNPNTYKLLRDLCFPDLPSTKTFKQLSELLTVHYGHKPIVWLERSIFQEARQEQNESISQWYARICSLIVDCSYQEEGELKNKLKEKFVTGMKKGKIFSRMCEEDATTSLEKLLEIARKKENVNHEDGEVKFVKNGKRKLPSWKDKNNGGKAQNPGTRSDDSDFHHDTRRRRRRDDSQPTNDRNQCKICNKRHDGECFYKHSKCHKCKRRGHFARNCKNKKINFVSEEHINDSSVIIETDEVWHVDVIPEIVDSKILMCCNSPVISNSNNRFIVGIDIDKKTYKMEIDTGASISAVNRNFYQSNFSKYALKKDSLVLRSYNSSVFKPDGYFIARVGYNNKNKLIKFYVVEDGAASILGRNWLDAFDISFTMVNRLSVENRVDEVVKEFPEVFSNKIGCFKHAKIPLHLKEDTIPVFCKPRPVPLAYRTKMDEELIRLEEEGIITPISTSGWATPLVPVLKNDGNVRICADYKVTVNKHLKNMHYPLPRIEEIFSKLHKGKYYTKLDLESAYRQFEMEDDAKRILTWSTHRGLYQVNRLPFGVTIASFVFQKHIEQLFVGMDNVVNYLDDILVTGETDSEHIEVLRRVLEILKDAGLTLKLEKCEFFKEEIEYLGHNISRQGLTKSEKKVQAIKGARRPTTVTEVRSFLGLINYYNKFIPNAAHILKPIYNLLKDNVDFIWTKQCEDAFEKVKEILASEQVLVHYNPELPVIVVTDASDTGIAAILIHVMPNGEERPVCCTSRTLMPAEENYSTIQKEALAIYYGVSKFYQYLYGKKFVIRTDHRPLVALFSEKKGIPVMHANRLQRWATYLSGFNYEIQYIKGRDNVVADYFSRAPLKVITKTDEYSGKGDYINFTNSVEDWPINNEEVKRRSEEDTEIQEVMEYVKKRKWPTETDEKMKAYYNRKEELVVQNDILLWGHRIVVPRSLRQKLLQELHSHHFGIVKTKNIARAYIYWPGIDKEIEDTCKTCMYCLENRPLPPKAELTPWKIASEPWNRVHMDYLGPINGTMFLLMIDAYSKWMEVYKVKNMTSIETEEKIKDACSRWGIPKVIVTDNGTQFTASNIQALFKRNGIKHITTPIANPASNGSAENAVRTFKTNIKIRLSDPKNKGKTINVLVSEFLFSYRTTAHCTTKEVPAKLFLKRMVRTRLDILRETTREEEKSEVNTPILESIQKAQQRQEKNFRGRKRKFEIGEAVMVTDYRTVNQRKWVAANIVEKIGKNTYLCKIIEGNIWKRHANQIIRRKESGESEMRGETKTETKPITRTSKTYIFTSIPKTDATLQDKQTVDAPGEIEQTGKNDTEASTTATGMPEASSSATITNEPNSRQVNHEIVNDNQNTKGRKGGIHKTPNNKPVKHDKRSTVIRNVSHKIGKERDVTNTSSNVDTQRQGKLSRQVKVPQKYKDFVLDFD